MKKLYSKIAFALLISFFPYTVIGQDDLPPEQLAMLEQLPPDQRESIKEKLRVATGLQGEIAAERVRRKKALEAEAHRKRRLKNTIIITVSIVAAVIILTLEIIYLKGAL